MSPKGKTKNIDPHMQHNKNVDPHVKNNGMHDADVMSNHMGITKKKATKKGKK